MTWERLKIITLQKMFEITGDTLVIDDMTEPYIKSMPAAANEALLLCATDGRYIQKKINVTIDEENTGAFDFNEFVDDFYSFDGCGVFKIEEEKIIGRVKFFNISGSTFLLTVAGTYLIYYNAYPKAITAQTPDDEELVLHPEVAAIIPLYMASQLYKDDDNGLATQYRNEFEAARAIIRNNSNINRSGFDSFTTITNWV